MKSYKKQYQGFKIQGDTAFAKGRRMTRYPSNKTIEKLKALKIKEIVWQNGDFIAL